MKNCYTEKRLITICGLLDEDEEGNLQIIVENKDGVEVHGLDSVIKKMIGTQICIKNEEVLYE